MSEREDFLARWSRRKHQATEEAEKPPIAGEPDAPEQWTDGDEAFDKEKPSQSTEPLFDPTTLPSLESITAETDIRAFLAPGVPAELTRAALRRAWTTDPKIRDFVGLADYAWDFNAPGAMAGFGALEMTDALRREIVGMLTRGQSRERPSENSASAPPENIEQPPGEIELDRTDARWQSKPHEGASPKDGGQSNQDMNCDGSKNVAAQYQAGGHDQPHTPVQRRHGSALPQD
jgi:hypothetical protein